MTETPPRTWRRLNEFHHEPGRRWKHLHGRGEDAVGRHSFCGAAETPPRTWRRPRYIEILRSHFGKHLHGRGEDLRAISLIWNEWETPPRTWRRLAKANILKQRSRNTSTDVEKTRRLMCGIWLRRKHLHGRGEDENPDESPEVYLETPPRTWRRRDVKLLPEFTLRNTSTDVEKT